MRPCFVPVFLAVFALGVPLAAAADAKPTAADLNLKFGECVEACAAKGLDYEQAVAATLQGDAKAFQRWAKWTVGPGLKPFDGAASVINAEVWLAVMEKLGDDKFSALMVQLGDTQRRKMRAELKSANANRLFQRFPKTLLDH